MTAPDGTDDVLLDACCVLNLHASRRMAEILQNCGPRFLAARLAAQESLYIERRDDAMDVAEREPVDLAPPVEAGLLNVLDLEGEQELATFVSFAALVDDGEAATIALAVHRGYRIATDDRRTRNVIRANVPHVPLVSTSEIIKLWADRCRLGLPALKEVLMNIRFGARFAPRRHDPLVQW